MKKSVSEGFTIGLRALGAPREGTGVLQQQKDP